jgi:hypothetical protein
MVAMTTLGAVCWPQVPPERLRDPEDLVRFTAGQVRPLVH